MSPSPSPRSPGHRSRAGDEVAVVETIKVNLSLPSPVDGRSSSQRRPLELSRARQPGPLRQGLAGRARGRGRRSGAECSDDGGRVHGPGQGPSGSGGPAMSGRARSRSSPAAGSAKSLGAAAREAAFILAEDLRPDTTKIVALSLLVMGDEQAKRGGRRRRGRRHRRLQARVRRQGAGLLRRRQGAQGRGLRRHPAPSRPQARRRLRPQRGRAEAGPSDGR